MKKVYFLLAAILVAALLVLLSACQGSTPTPTASPSPSPSPKPTAAPAPTTTAAPAKADAASIARGGLIYDKWWKAIENTAEPTTDHPLWSLQTTNTAKGSATWRCKECHGWDYKGKDGAYAKGSHATGFPGVYTAGTTRTKAQLLDVLKGTANAKHSFTSYLGEKGLTDVVNFLSEGLIDESKVIDYATKKAIGANIDNGKKLYDSSCAACHGADGKTLKFDGKDVMGSIATGNPWETLHKIRIGQPDSAMPRTIELGWKLQDAVDVLGYSQTLPKE